MKNIGLEIFIANREKSYYFATEEEQQREEIYNAILKKVNKDCITEVSIERVTQLWVNREITNF